MHITMSEKKITKEALFRNKRFKFDVNGFAKCFKTYLPFFWNPHSFCISEISEFSNPNLARGIAMKNAFR